MVLPPQNHTSPPGRPHAARAHNWPALPALVLIWFMNTQNTHSQSHVHSSRSRCLFHHTMAHCHAPSPPLRPPPRALISSPVVLFLARVGLVIRERWRQALS